MLGSFVAVVTLWANVNSSQSRETSTKTNPSKAAEKIFHQMLYPHTHRLLGVVVFWKDKATSPKIKKCQKSPENNHRIHQGNNRVFLEGQSPLPSNFLMCGILRTAPCLDATPGLWKQDLKAGSDTLHGFASAISYVSIILCLHHSASKSLLKDTRKDPHCRALEKALKSCKYIPATRSAVTTAVAITLQALQLPPTVPAGHTASAAAAVAHGTGPHTLQALLPSPPQPQFPYIKAY